MANKKNIGSVSTKISEETKEVITKKKIVNDNVVEPLKIDLTKPTDTEDEIILNDEVLLRDSNVEKTGEEKILRMSDTVVIDSNLKRHESGYIISTDDYNEENKSYLNIALVAKRYYKKSYEKIIDTQIRELIQWYY